VWFLVYVPLFSSLSEGSRDRESAIRIHRSIRQTVTERFSTKDGCVSGTFRQLLNPRDNALSDMSIAGSYGITTKPINVALNLQ